MSKKFCVFCGKKPSKKNKEHIIPRWLIELTGDLNREILVGRDWSDGSLKNRVFRFSSFTLPSCKKCNDDFGILERETKPILLSIMREESVTECEINKLLDWFDKVRVGLWLSSFVLNKNYNGIIPHYHIQDRVGAADRALLVYKTEEEQDGISFIGTDGPLFHNMPSVFGIKINKYYFVNISTPLLLHQCFGISNTLRHELQSESELNYYSLETGSGAVSIPEFIDSFPGKNIAFVQAIKLDDLNGKNQFGDLYSTGSSIDLFKGNRGKVYICKDRKFESMHENQSCSIEITRTLLMLNFSLGKSVMNYQEDLFLKSSKYDDILGGKEPNARKTIDDVLMLHRTIKSIYSKQVQQTYRNVLSGT